MKLKFICILGSILWSAGVFAQQDALSFNLDEAQAYAMQYNKTLKNAGRDIQLAEQKIKEANGAGLPQVSGSIDYMTNFNYEFALDFGMGSGETPEIPAGLEPGDYAVLGYIAELMAPSEPTPIVMEDQFNANIQVSQLIFSGQYWVGREMAKVGKTLAQSSYIMTELDIKETVASTYYVALLTQEMLDILDANIENLEEMKEHTNNMLIMGMAEQTDVDQIKITVSQLENTKRSTERNLQLSMNMFRFILGIEGGQEVELKGKLADLVTGLSPLAVDGEAFDMSVNPSYQLMAAQTDLTQKSVDMQKWTYAPTVVGFYSYTEKILTSSFDLSPKNVAGVSVSVPIFEGGAKQAKLSQAKIELDKMERSQAIVEETLAISNNQLLFDLNSAWENYSLQKENIEVAKRVYDNTYNKYKQGMVSSLELTMANNNYLMAENNYATAMLNLLQADMKLNKLYNKL